LAVYYYCSEGEGGDDECMPCVYKLVPLRDQPSGWSAAPRRSRPVGGRRRPARGGKRARRLGAGLIAAAVAITSVGVAAAASRGTETGGLGAGSSVVAACGSGTTASYTPTYDASIPGYSVSRVNLAGIPGGCLGKSYEIRLIGPSGVTVGSELAGTLPTSGATADIATSGNPDARLVTGVSVVIS
jgi:hypothetical protein